MMIEQKGVQEETEKRNPEEIIQKLQISKRANKHTFLKVKSHAFLCCRHMQQFQVEASVEAVQFQKAEKVRLNKELHRKDRFVESSLYLWKQRSKVFHCVQEEWNKTNNKIHFWILAITFG